MVKKKNFVAVAIVLLFAVVGTGEVVLHNSPEYALLTMAKDMGRAQCVRAGRKRPPDYRYAGSWFRQSGSTLHGKGQQKRTDTMAEYEC